MKTPNAPGAPRFSGSGQYGKGISKSKMAANGIGTGNPKKLTIQGQKVKKPTRDTKKDSTRTVMVKLAQVDKDLRKTRGVSGPSAEVWAKGFSLIRNGYFIPKKGMGKTRNSVALVNKAAMKKTPIKPSKPKVQKKTGRK